MLYDPQLAKRIDAKEGRLGMVGVLMQSRQYADTMTETVKTYEEQLGSLKQSQFYKAMQELKDSVIQ